MTRVGLSTLIALVFGAATFLAQGQPTTFPLAAPTGKDSNAKTTPPPGAQNQGALNPMRQAAARSGIRSS
jgi:hypothetical protein